MKPTGFTLHLRTQSPRKQQFKAFMVSAVSKGDAVLLTVNGGDRYAFVRAENGNRIQIGKHASVDASQLVGAKYGSTLELNPMNRCLERVRNARDPSEMLAAITRSAGDEVKSNASLLDSNAAQSLSSDDVRQLRLNRTGEEVVEQLAEHSASFACKPAYSQEKWKQRKLRRHSAIVTVCSPSADVVAHAYFAQAPKRISFLRPDTLSSLLFFADIVPGTRCVVIDGCAGLVTGSAAARLGGRGIVASCIDPLKAQRFDSLKYQRLGSAGWSCIRAVDLCSLTRGVLSSQLASQQHNTLHGDRTLDQDECEDRDENGGSCEKTSVELMRVDQNEVRMMTEDGNKDVLDMESSQKESAETSNENASPAGNVDFEKGRQRIAARVPMTFASDEELQEWRRIGLNSCIICHAGADIMPTIRELFAVLQPASPFVIWSPTLEPLAEARLQLGRSPATVNLHLQEPWQRPYQVLPMRTHPHMNVDGAGGYLLSGYVVA